MYDDNKVIILQASCGCGKTYAVAKYVAESKDKVISIVNRRSLLSAQIREFNAHRTDIKDYSNKEAYNLEESGIICINSIMKYGRVQDFKEFVIFIDEINSLLETLTHSSILLKDIKLMYAVLIRMIKTCKKVFFADNTILENAFMLINTKVLKKKGTSFLC
jgi:hypothetical protein